MEEVSVERKHDGLVFTGDWSGGRLERKFLALGSLFFLELVLEFR